MKQKMYFEDCAVVLELGICGLTIVRSLHKSKIKIYGFHTDSDAQIGYYSKYVKTSKFSSNNELLTKLIKFAESRLEKSIQTSMSMKERRPLLFCSTDEMVNFVLHNAKKLEKYFVFHYWNLDLYSNIINKNLFHQLLNKTSNISYPKTASLSFLHYHNEIENMTPPFIVKPVNTFGSPKTDLFGHEKNLIFNSTNDLLLFVKKNRSHLKDMIIQEIIPHTDEDVVFFLGYIDEVYKLKSFFSGRKIRSYLPLYGVASFAVSEQLDDLRNDAIKFLKSIKYRGFFDIEFIYDKRDNTYKLIEINPRLTPLLPLANASRIKIIESAIYNKEYLTQKNDKYYMNILVDIGSFIRMRRQKKITMLAYLRSITKARTFVIFDIFDIKPFVISIMKLFGLSWMLR